MKNLISIAALGLLALTSCASKSDTQNSATETADSIAANTDVVIRGNWMIEDVVAGDSARYTPGQVNPDEPRYMRFLVEEGQERFVAETDCNNISGTYSVAGDSIQFGPLMMTRMACPNTELEAIMSTVLPTVSTVVIDTDSTLTLRGTNGYYISLLRAADVVEE